MPFPPLPPSLSFDTIPELINIKEMLEKGFMSLNDAELSIANLAESAERKNELCSTAHEFTTQKQESNDTFIEFTSAREFTSLRQHNNNDFFQMYRPSLLEKSKSLIINENNDSCDTSARECPSLLQHNNNDFFQMYRSSSIEKSKSLVINESNDACDTVENNSSLAEQRLAHVEQMLQTILNQISHGPNSITQTHQSSQKRATPTRSSNFSSGLSMVSALSQSDNIIDDSSVGEKAMRENNELRKEIEALKLKLASVQYQQPPLDETMSTSVSPHRSKKKRKRKLMKKPWK